jgi:hypothetical protein
LLDATPIKKSIRGANVCANQLIRRDIDAAQADVGGDIAIPPRAGGERRTGVPYWVTMGLDGKYVYASTGDVIDRATRQVVAALTDEWGRPVRSEKILEMLWVDGKPVGNSDQFGRGMLTGDSSMVSSR